MRSAPRKPDRESCEDRFGEDPHGCRTEIDLGSVDYRSDNFAVRVVGVLIFA